MALSSAERQRRYRRRTHARIMALPPVPCECGCGHPVPPINKQGKRARYAHGHNPTTTPPPPTAESQAKAAEARRRPGNEWSVRGGYVRVTLHPHDAAQHPTAVEHGGTWSIPRSHLVWNENNPADPVVPGEQIHHLNRRRDDDYIANLTKLDAAEHRALHARERSRRSLGGVI